ncbi:MAG: hypothetical protein J5640_01795 [Bacteroidales bacterium]|nr:hypothetical protein [Bacteroidales bacterium]
MRKTVVLLIAAATSLCSCSREMVQEVPARAGTSLTISVPVSKTVLGEDTGSGHQLYWADGDRVAVNGAVSDALSGVPAAATGATFAFQDVLSAPYSAVYPSDIWKSATQVLLPLKASDAIIPLCGASASGQLTLAALTSAVRVKVKSDGNHAHNIRRIEITSADTQLSGVFDIDFAAATLAATSSAGEDKRVCIEGDWPLSVTDPLDLVIPVPAGTYGITVKVLDVQGHFLTRETTSPKTFSAGTIKAFPEILFTPTGTQFDITID